MSHMSKSSSEQRSLGRRISGVTMPIARKRAKWCRNWPCLCGSGKKYKHCCLADINKLTQADRNEAVREIPEDIQEVVRQHREAQAEKGLITDE